MSHRGTHVARGWRVYQFGYVSDSGWDPSKVRRSSITTTGRRLLLKQREEEVWPTLEERECAYYNPTTTSQLQTRVFCALPAGPSTTKNHPSRLSSSYDYYSSTITSNSRRSGGSWRSLNLAQGSGRYCGPSIEGGFTNLVNFATRIYQIRPKVVRENYAFWQLALILGSISLVKPL